MECAVKIIVAEDEQPQREALVAELGTLWPEATVIACADGLEALEAFHREQPVVAFLDVRMPGLSGLEVGRAMASTAQVVFITAHDDAAVQAFEQGAVDYLLKPVRTDRLQKAIDRVRERLRATSTVDVGKVIDQLRAQLASKPQTLKWVTASAGEVTKLYAIDDVIAFQAHDKYTRVLTANDEAIIRTSLRELLVQLDPEVFWQVHRSVIVRASAIERVRRTELTLRLRGLSEEFPVSAAFQSRLRSM